MSAATRERERLVKLRAFLGKSRDLNLDQKIYNLDRVIEREELETAPNWGEGEI